ncbi:MAG: hypothetical protein D6768_07525 [Chloroflexi bacterium]|nr:MAG: hypothetical protein D6768_07525 [Chloroflexota bacterium]
MVTQTKPLAEITQEAIKVLFQTLGVVNTIRFINQFTTGYGNYTEERDALFGDKTLDDIISEIRLDRSKPN